MLGAVLKIIGLSVLFGAYNFVDVLESKCDDTTITFHYDNKKETNTIVNNGGNYIQQYIDFPYFNNYFDSIRGDRPNYAWFFEGDFSCAALGEFKYLYVGARNGSNYIMGGNVYTPGSSTLEQNYFVFRESNLSLGLYNQFIYYRGSIYTRLGAVANVFYFDNTYATDFQDVPFTYFTNGLNEGNTSVFFNNNIEFMNPLSLPMPSKTYGTITRWNNQYFTSTETTEYITANIDLPVFVCPDIGQPYNRIQFRYKSAVGYIFYDSYRDVEWQGEYWDYHTGVSGEYFFYDVFYIDVASNYKRRVASNVITNNGDGNLVLNDFMWFNESYASLKFFSINTDNIKLQLNILGSSLIDNPVIVSTPTHYGGNYLSETFDLIRMAFGGLTNLMQLSLLPNLTLGVLLLVPFGITIILFCVKLFKR